MSITRTLSVVPRRTMASQVTPSKSSSPTESSADSPKSSRMDFSNYVGNSSVRKDKYLNPLLTPPPRSPKSVEDFKNPGKLGHWYPLGFDYTNPVKDKYLFHEFLGMGIFTVTFTFWMWLYRPDFDLKEWAVREAYLRTAKREALGLPLIDRNVVPPERVVLPTEEELKLAPFPIHY